MGAVRAARTEDRKQEEGMGSTKLTKWALDKLLSKAENPRGDPAYDSELNGFGVLVYPDRRAVFFVQLPGAGTQKRVTIGQLGELSVEEARSKAAAMLAERAARKVTALTAEASGTVMEVVPITADEFERLSKAGTNRAPMGHNRALLTRAEKEVLKLVFESERRAINKLISLYVMRRRLNSQVRIVRRGTTLLMGPGEYVASLRKGRG